VNARVDPRYSVSYEAGAPRLSVLLGRSEDALNSDLLEVFVLVGILLKHFTVNIILLLCSDAVVQKIHIIVNEGRSDLFKLLLELEMSQLAAI
jgi:hypothetical protein